MKRKISLIRLTLTIILIGTTVIASLIVYTAYSRSGRYALLQSYEHMENIINLVSQEVGDKLYRRLNSLSTSKEELVRRDMHDSVVKILFNDFDIVGYIDREGNIVRYFSKSKELPQANISYREYFIKTKETLKPYISDSFRSIIGDYAIVLTIPIIEDNSFNGLIAGAILIENHSINRFIASSRFYRTGRTRILDSRGVVLFSEDPTEVGKIYNKFPLDNGYRSIKIEHIDGKDYVVGVSSIPGTNWKVLTTVEKGDILFFAYRNLRYMVILSIILLLALIVIIFIPLRKLTNSLNLLRRIAVDYVLGNPPQNISITNFSEINDIVSAFREMRNIIRERENRLKEEQTYLETLLLEMGEGVLVLDRDKKIKFVNRKFTEMTGYSERELNNIYLAEIFESKDREVILTSSEECLEEGECKGRANILSKDGRLVPVLISVRMLRINEEILEYLLVFSDLTEIEKRERELEDALEEIKTLNEELNKRTQQLEIALASLDMKLFEVERAKEAAEKLAITDPLTGLFNRRFLEEKLANELIRAKAYNTYLSIVMADIDHFKRINDTYGHKVGDEVLKTLAVILKANLRGEDVVARYGGEEFIIILHNTSKYDAFRVAERIRIQVEETSFLEIGIPEKITVSFGISCFSEDGEDPTELIRKADQALYQAKSQGRNRVVTFTEPSASIHF